MISRTLTKPVQLNFVRLSLNDLLKNTVDIMIPKAHMANVDIKIFLTNNDIYAKVDKDSIQEAFVNLIENAIHAMEDGGTLTIRLSRIQKHGKALIEFEDTGVGIEEENLERIFKLFFTTKKNGSTGTDLGAKYHQESQWKHSCEKQGQPGNYILC